MPPSQELSSSLGEAKPQEEKTYRWEWTEEQADSPNAAREPEEDRHVHRWRCCKCFITFPHCGNVDHFAELVITSVTVIILLVFLSRIFPQFTDAQDRMRWGASAILAEQDQWVLCPDTIEKSSNKHVSGVVQFSGFRFPDITCTNGNQAVSMALPKEALALLGFMSFFYRAGEDGSWCYTPKDIANFFERAKPQTGLRSMLTEPDGGCMSKSQNHSCIIHAMNLIPDWHQECIGLSRWGFSQPVRNPPTGIILQWIEEWTLEDVLSFEYTTPGDKTPHVDLVMRMNNTLAQQRYDYVVPLAGITVHKRPALNKFNEVLQALLNVSTMSEWAYNIREAFVQSFQNSTGGTGMYKCLLDPTSFKIKLGSLFESPEDKDPEDKDIVKLNCFDNIDKSKWDRYQVAYDLQKGMFMEDWWFLHMNYDVFLAYWTGLVVALASALFSTIALFLYFLVAGCRSCVKLRKKQRRAAAGPKEVVGRPRLVPVQHACNEDAALLQAEAGSTASPVQNYEI